MTINLDQYTNTLNVTDTATNADLNVNSKGTGNIVFTANTKAFTFVGDTGANRVQLRSGGNLGLYAQAGGALGFYTNTAGDVLQVQIAHTASAVNYVQATGSATGNAPYFSSQGSDTNISFAYTAKGTGNHDFYTSGTSFTQQFKISHTASAVNYVQVTGAATGNGVTLSAQGSDSNVQFYYVSKGTFPHSFLNSAGNEQFRISPTASAVNFFQATGSATGVGVVFSAQGADANINAVLQPKGTGALQAQQTDSTATGGNARGANAVDWQTSRISASQVASASQSVISGGVNNTSSGGYAAIGGGLGNTTSGTVSYIGCGNGNTASSDYSTIVSGRQNTSAGFFNFIGTGQSNSGTASAAVTTQSGTMNGTTAVTLSGSNANIKVGQLITGTSIANYTYVAAISGTSLTLSQAASGSSTSTLSFYTPHGVVVGGGNNQATGSYSFIGGGGDAGTAANRNVASGDWSTVAGGRGNTASGVASFVGGGGLDGTSSLPNISSGIASVVNGGVSNNASGNYSTIVGGFSNTANSNISSVLGGRQGNTRSIVGNTVFSSCSAPIADATGITQSAMLILARQTTDATPTVLASNTSAASTTNQVILPNNSAYTFRGEIVSGVTGGGNSKSWTIEGLIKRGANAASTTLVGSTVTSMFADVGAATWTIALSADTTNGGLAVTFTGQASTTIRTVCQIRTTEMTY